MSSFQGGNCGTYRFHTSSRARCAVHDVFCTQGFVRWTCYNLVMLSPQQEEWIAHLSTEKTVVIVPFDSSAEQRFQRLKQMMRAELGEDIPVEHRGSTALGISGQDEIDVYIPVKRDDFPILETALIKLFGDPRSKYPARVRFDASTDSKRIDVFLIDKGHGDWLRGVAFEDICRKDPAILDSYRKLKEEMNGWSVQDFYRRKTEFINEVLESAVRR